MGGGERLPKLPSQCYAHGLGNLSDLGNNREIQPQFATCLMVGFSTSLGDMNKYNT